MQFLWIWGYHQEHDLFAKKLFWHRRPKKENINHIIGDRFQSRVRSIIDWRVNVILCETWSHIRSIHWNCQREHACVCGEDESSRGALWPTCPFDPPPPPLCQRSVSSPKQTQACFKHTAYVWSQASLVPTLMPVMLKKGGKMDVKPSPHRRSWYWAAVLWRLHVPQCPCSTPAGCCCWTTPPAWTPRLRRTGG